jgi:parallel beta-helix repeat protein
MAAAAALAPTGAQASAGVGCGDKITHNTVLHHDLTNCPNNGLKIVADHVTLDLNGHSLSGNGQLVEDCHMICDVGVFAGRKNDVTIKHGSIKRFGFGVLGFDVHSGLIHRVRTAANYFNGIALVKAHHFTVSNVVVSRNGLDVDYPGIALIHSDDNTVRRTKSVRNADLGLYTVDANDNRIIGNEFSHNPEAGMIFDGDRNVIKRNRVAKNGDGIIVGGNRLVVAANRVVSSTGCGDECGVGITLEDGDHSLIAANKVVNPENTGIRVKTFASEQTLSNIIVRDNHVEGAGRHGIHIGHRVEHALIQGNRVAGSARDGIHVDINAARIALNTADRNGDLGIDAARGVTDGGGNVAHGNGDPRQCKHVFCAT